MWHFYCYNILPCRAFFHLVHNQNNATRFHTYKEKKTVSFGNISMRLFYETW